MPTQSDFLATVQDLRGIDRLLEVTARLRHPTEGCPWDLKQTHRSLRRYMLEEAYEAVEAMSNTPEVDGQVVDTSVWEELKGELGDVLLQVALNSRLAEEAGQFDFNAVCETLADKLIRRHPHVFAPDDSAEIRDASDVNRQWAEIKQAEKAASGQSASSSTDGSQPLTGEKSVLDGISLAQPALSRALETSQKAVKVGFAWPDLDSLWACVMSEYDEFRAELPEGAFSDKDLPADLKDRLESEMGDILFASVNLARQFGIDPEVALTRATAKFTQRFQQMETLIARREGLEPGLSQKEKMQALDFETWDDLWKQAKKEVAHQEP